MSAEGAWSGRRLHLIAIGGAGMSGLALVAHALGARVSGSDRASSSYLERVLGAGIDAYVGHDAERVPADAEVVVSTAIAEDNPELVIARERGQRVLHRGQLLAELCAAHRVIAVAGTHGKTTTAGMIAWSLRALGAGAGYVIGGDLPGVDGAPAANAAPAAGEWLVVEADESDGSFLELEPEVAVVTNVELDHHSHWGSRAELIDAFARFCEPARAVVAGADPALDPLVSGKESARVEPDPVQRPRLAVPGAHNASNALAALAAIELAEPGFGTHTELESALAGFPGMGRRLELRGNYAGARIYDDYAHHPTEVAATLAAVRELDPARLIVVFQPHLYSRTKAMAAEFGAALAAADVIGVVDVYAAREQPHGELAGVSGLDVAREAAGRAAGRPVLWLRTIESALGRLRGFLRDGDVLVTMGAGDIFTLADALTEATT